MAQGFPHPESRGSGQSSRRELGHPFGNLLKKQGLEEKPALSASSQRELIGNAMHVAQIGVWFIYGSACADRRNADGKWPEAQ